MLTLQKGDTPVSDKFYEKWYQNLSGVTNNTPEKRFLEVYVPSCSFVESNMKKNWDVLN